MFFKDVVTEMTESLLKNINKNAMRCPVCHKGFLKRNDVLEHYIEVAVSKVASSIIGGAVPAPDYYYKCPQCKAICLLIDGKFIPIKK